MKDEAAGMPINNLLDFVVKRTRMVLILLNYLVK